MTLTNISAIVQFTDERDAKDAQDGMDRKEIDGREVESSFPEPTQDSTQNFDTRVQTLKS